ncbi:MAG: Vacuolar H+transporting two-sector ATPase F subunit [Spirochaetes bacterium]|nr:MAG: Vacuolar H+transporting two-sector ATPase F subunit [Spirochaetota bacterium]
MNYFVIGDEDSVLGFGMAGVRGTSVHNKQEAEEAFKSALDDREIGIIIITERIAELIGPLVEDYVFTKEFPLIVEIPDREGRISGKADLREMVYSAIGIKL